MEKMKRMRRREWGRWMLMCEFGVRLWFLGSIIEYLPLIFFFPIYLFPCTIRPVHLLLSILLLSVSDSSSFGPSWHYISNHTVILLIASAIGAAVVVQVQVFSFTFQGT
jgi:hypothetical protein